MTVKNGHLDIWTAAERDPHVRATENVRRACSAVEALCFLLVFGAFGVGAVLIIEASSADADIAATAIIAAVAVVPAVIVAALGWLATAYVRWRLSQ